MKVIGFNFKKISVEKKKEISQDLKVNFNIDIKDIKQPKIELFDGKNVFSFEYEFKIQYQPDYADIIFQGNMLIVIEDDEIAKDIEKEWKNKKVSEKVLLPIHNIIISKCNLKALQLEEDLNLPTHQQYPRLSKPQDNSNQ